MKKSAHFSFWLFIIIAIILVVFSVQNSGPISVTIIFKQVQISLAILLVLTFLGGLITGALYAFVKFSHKKKEEIPPAENAKPADKNNDGDTAF
jgi:uncharacterized integral membrane protein